jgi:hypothetical protein
MVAKSKEISVKTTALILSVDDIDFDKVNKHIKIIKYYPRKSIFNHKKTYYQQLHNLIKNQTDYPVYINKYHQALYLCMPVTEKPPELYDTTNVVMKTEVFDSNDPRDLHILLKVAIARFFISDTLDEHFQQIRVFYLKILFLQLLANLQHL